MRARTAALAAVVALLAIAPLTACGAHAENSDHRAPDASPDASPGGTPDASPSAEAATGGGAGCLIGDWRIAEDQMQAYYDAVNAEMIAQGMHFDVSGSAGVIFRDDATYAYKPELILLVTPDSGTAATATLGGSIEGTWSAQDQSITTAHDTNTLSMTVAVDGQTIDASDLTDEFIAMSPINQSRVDCSGTLPAMELPTANGSVMVTLARP